MAYRYSKIDNDNIGWFKKDFSNATLLGVQLEEGNLRGLNKFNVEFEYPISVFSGKNGSGKSTLLALASCAYHNSSDGFSLPANKNTYYTFSDFFIQSKSDIPPQGIKIRYKILYDNWRKSKNVPTGKGIGRQIRKKKVGGKWNDYSRRVKRNVVYLGIDRVVPQSEKAVYRNYKSYFKKSPSLGWEDKVKETVSKILGKNYEDFWFIKHGKYRIPVAQVNGQVYSGFNMGAGENALFEVFSIIYGCPKGVLIVIDEIELGLHEEAQKLFIKELKIVCKSQKSQIIATTHSMTILKHLPPIARFYIESFQNNTIISDSISAMYAGGKLAGENSNELDVFVEDVVAKRILELALSNDIRNRINILNIGSSSAISRQMAARYKNLKKGDCIAIMDGDKNGKFKEHKTVFLNALESVSSNDEIENWLNSRLEYLPGDTWPESWVVNELKKSECTYLTETIGLSFEELNAKFDVALLAGKHNEFYSLAEQVNLDVGFITSICAKQVINNCEEKFKLLEEFITEKLKEN